MKSALLMEFSVKRGEIRRREEASHFLLGAREAISRAKYIVVCCFVVYASCSARQRLCLRDDRALGRENNTSFIYKPEMTRYMAALYNSYPRP